MDSSIVYTLIVVSIFGLVGLLGVLFRPPADTEDDDGSFTLYYGTMFRGAGVLFGIIVPVGIIAILIAVVANSEGKVKDESVWGGVCTFLFFLLLGGFILLDAFKTKVVVSPEGVSKYAPWHKPVRLQWREIAQVWYSQILSAVVPKDAKGKRLSVSTYLEDVCDFFEELNQRTRHRIDTDSYG